MFKESMINKPHEPKFANLNSPTSTTFSSHTSFDMTSSSNSGDFFSLLLFSPTIKPNLQFPFSNNSQGIGNSDRLDKVTRRCPNPYFLRIRCVSNLTCLFAQSYDLVEECHRDVIGFINYSLEYN